MTTLTLAIAGTYVIQAAAAAVAVYVLWLAITEAGR